MFTGEKRNGQNNFLWLRKVRMWLKMGSENLLILIDRDEFVIVIAKCH